jgi:DNA-binding transcriptional LysR family regulator
LEELEAARGNIVSRIAIGNIPHSATQVLSNAVRELLSKYPTARVQIVDNHYENLLNDLRAGKLDLLFGVLRRPDWATDVKEELLFTNHYVVVARIGHPLLKIKRPTLRDLSRYDWIMPGPTKSVASSFGEPFDGTEGQHRNDIIANIPDNTFCDQPAYADVSVRSAIE